MGLLDMLFGGGDQPQGAGRPAIDPTAMNPIYGIPEGLLAEIKKEQQKAEMGQAWANLFGGAANIARGVQGGPPAYDPGSAGGAGGGGGLAIDGIVERAMKFSQLRDMMDKRQQLASQRAAIPQLAKALGIPESMAAGLIDRLPSMYEKHKDADFAAQADVRKITETAKASGINDPAEIQKLIGRQFQQVPEIKEITLPNGEKMSVQIMPDRSVRDLTGNPIAPNILQGGGGPSKAQNEGENQLLGHYMASPEVKTYAAADPIYRSIVKSATTDTGASDLDMVYGIAKILDPTSVVREGEIQMANSTGGTVAMFQGLLNQLNGGAKLNPETRAKLLDMAQNRMGELRGAHDQVTSQLYDIAGRRGLNKDNIVTRKYDPLPDAPVFSPQTGTFIPNEFVSRLRSIDIRENPEAIAEFNARFGNGAAQRVLRIR